jgi:hypothetical protein
MIRQRLGIRTNGWRMFAAAAAATGQDSLVNG